MVYGYIYKLTSPDGRIYIGQTKDIKRRWKRHERNSHQNHLAYISQAIHKYGWNNFIKEIIDEAQSFDELNNLEMKYISEYNSTNRETGFNQSSGGHVWRYKDWDKEIKERVAKKLSECMSGNKNPMSLESIAKRNNCSIEEASQLTPGYHREVSEYNKKRASETHKGKIVSQETREKMRQNQLKYTYVIINSETNQKWETKNLFKWCKENDIPYSIMSQRAENKQQRSFRKYKEWNIVKL